jgi:hypothetical protein
MRRVIDIEHNSHALLRLVGSALICCLLAQPAAAEESDAASSERGLSPNYVWLSASAALVTASVGGLFALRVSSIYEQARALPGVSPERLPLKRDAERAEFTADCLFASAAALGITSVLLALATDWSRLQTPTDKSRIQTPTDQKDRASRTRLELQLMPVAWRDGATLILRGVLP